MSENPTNPGKELPKIDPAKLFDESQYNTIKIGGETGAQEKIKGGAAEELLELLSSKTIGDKDKALALLKKEKGVALLINTIKECKNPKDKALLVAACWECGMDLSAHLEYFAEMVHDEDLFVSMEAVTVVSENIGGVEKLQAQQLINILSKAAEDHFNYALIQDVIESLKSRL